MCPRPGAVSCPECFATQTLGEEVVSQGQIWASSSVGSHGLDSYIFAS